MGKKIQDYKELPGYEVKAIPTFIKEINEEQGIVQHFISIQGITDLGNDIVMSGSFAKTLTERGPRVKVLDQHNTDSALRVVGKPLAIREVGRNELPSEVLQKYPDATGGVLATTQYALETDNGRNMFKLVQGGYLPETSIGFDALDVSYEDVVVDGKTKTVRKIHTLRLWEYSNVIWPMCQAVTTVSVKEAGNMGESKRAVPFGDLPLAGRDRGWDGDGAVGRVREWAGGDDVDWAKYRKAFLWYDVENAETFGAYKLPFADVIDGELTAVPAGLFAAAAAVQGARGGADLGEDEGAVKRVLERYYAKMAEAFEDEGIVAPWKKEKAVNLSQQVDDVREAFQHQYNTPNNWNYWVSTVYDEYIVVEYESSEGNQWYQVRYTREGDEIRFAPRDEWVEGAYTFIPGGQASADPVTTRKELVDGRPVRRLGDVVQGSIHRLFTMFMDDLYVSGYLSRDQRIQCSGVIGRALDVLTAELPAELAGIELPGPDMMFMAAPGPDDEKAGRVLAERNARRVTAALRALIDVLADAGIDLDGETEDEGKTLPANATVQETAIEETAGPGSPPPTAAIAAQLEIELTRIKQLLEE